jgi:hypothetical protein
MSVEKTIPGIPYGFVHLDAQLQGIIMPLPFYISLSDITFLRENLESIHPVAGHECLQEKMLANEVLVFKCRV